MRPIGIFFGERYREADTRDAAILIRQGAALGVSQPIKRSGAEWEFAGSMLIDANDTSDTTVTIANEDATGEVSLIVAGLGIEIERATGDPTITFDTQGADKFTMGVDDDNDYFKINGGGSLAAASHLCLTDGGMLLLSDNANANMAIGMTINQGANDDEAIALKSSDEDHAG